MFWPGSCMAMTPFSFSGWSSSLVHYKFGELFWKTKRLSRKNKVLEFEYLWNFLAGQHLDMTNISSQNVFWEQWFCLHVLFTLFFRLELSIPACEAIQHHAGRRNWNGLDNRNPKIIRESSFFSFSACVIAVNRRCMFLTTTTICDGRNTICVNEICSSRFLRQRDVSFLIFFSVIIGSGGVIFSNVYAVIFVFIALKDSCTHRLTTRNNVHAVNEWNGTFHSLSLFL